MMLSSDMEYSNINLHGLSGIFVNRFLFPVLVAKRAKQLKRGAKPLVEVPEDQEIVDYIALAIQEFKSGAITALKRKDKDSYIDSMRQMEEYMDAKVGPDKGIKSFDKKENDKKVKDTKRSRTKSLSA